MLKSQLLDLNTKIERLKSQRATSLSLFNQLEKDLLNLKQQIIDLDHTFIVYDYFLKNNNDKIKIFEETITSGLQDVFNDKYKFNFNIKKNGNNLACDFLLTTDKHNYPLDIYVQGNGVKEIIGTIIQLLIVKLKGSAPILILDEPYAGLSDFRQPVVATFLTNVAKEFGIQLIIISHSHKFVDVADNTIEV